MEGNTALSGVVIDSAAIDDYRRITGHGRMHEELIAREIEEQVINQIEDNSVLMRRRVDDAGECKGDYRPVTRFVGFETHDTIFAQLYIHEGPADAPRWGIRRLWKHDDLSEYWELASATPADDPEAGTARNSTASEHLRALPHRLFVAAGMLSLGCDRSREMADALLRDALILMKSAQIDTEEVQE